MRERIAERLDDVLASLFFLIDHGDIGALRLALERVSPALKAEQMAVQLPKLADALQEPDGTTQEFMRVILLAVASGEIDSQRGSALLQAIGHVAEADELERLAALRREALSDTGEDLL